jgi:hypothetical protein
MLGQQVLQGDSLLLHRGLRSAKPRFLLQVFVDLGDAASRHGSDNMGEGDKLSRRVPEAPIIGAAMPHLGERLIELVYWLHADAIPPEFHLKHVSGTLALAIAGARIYEVTATQSRIHRLNHPTIV